MGKPKLLFVDDERQILTALRAIFRSKYQVFLAENPREALAIVNQEHIHIIVSDQGLPQLLGCELLRKVREKSPDTARLLLAGFADMQTAMGSAREGDIFRFINKPWSNKEIHAAIDGAIKFALKKERGLTVRNRGNRSSIVAREPSDSVAARQSIGKLKELRNRYRLAS